MTMVEQPNEREATDEADSAPIHHAPEVEELLQRAIEMVETARPMPLSTSLMINGEPLVELLHAAIAALPEELREARWLRRERYEYLEGVRREGEEITAIARSRAEHMVDRTEVVKSAEQRAQRVLSVAEAEARQMRRETEDFCDARQATLEGILNRTRSIVVTGRHRMQGTVVDLTEQTAAVDLEAEGIGLFDQDLS